MEHGVHQILCVGMKCFLNDRVTAIDIRLSSRWSVTCAANG
jgi:hypothetical protein